VKDGWIDLTHVISMAGHKAVVKPVGFALGFVSDMMG